jgi:Ca2+-binding RTX toxin-like protein
VGNAGDDSLDGGAGNDKLVGGLGNDTYVVGSAGDLLIENAGEGTDTVQASISYTLAANVENLVLIGEADLRATGNSLDNRLDANAGNDTLDGGAGNDTLNGNLFGNDTLIAGSGNDDLRGDFGIGLFEMEGGGNDTVFGFNVDPFYFHFPHLYTQTLSVTDKLSSELSLSASDGDLILNFASGDEITVHNGLSEFTQFDEYIFGDKTQTLTQLIQTHGDFGLTSASDTVDFSDLPAGVSVQAGAGDDTVYGAVVGSNRLDGGDGNDRLHAGAAGNDTLAGGAGSDTLYGGAGTDTLQLTSVLGSDTVFDFSSGTDRVEISQRALPVGNGNTTLDGAATRAAPGGFATSAELVIFISDISGAITTAGAAAHIGNATSAYALGQTTLFVVDNGTDSAVYYFKSAGNDAMVSVSELTLLVTLSGTAHTDVPDYLLGA